jgi:hypothetical protein
MTIETTTYTNSFGIRLSSGDGDEYAGCRLIISGGHKYITINLPQLISPKREKVYPTSWDAATVARLGRSWYYNYTEREYGFTIFEHHVSILYGLQADDSSIDQRKGFFIPWLERRCTQHICYLINGTVLDQSHQSFKDGSYEKNRNIIESARKIRYQFKDFDGELIEVDCYVEKYEWKQGTGRFKWVDVFCKPITKWYVNLEFSSGMGRRKGSWKGGTLGHACEIDVANDETIIEAFKQYCSNNELTFVGAVPWIKKVKPIRIEECYGTVINEGNQNEILSN